MAVYHTLSLTITAKIERVWYSFQPNNSEQTQKEREEEGQQKREENFMKILKFLDQA